MYIYTEDDDRTFAAELAAREQYDEGYKAGYKAGYAASEKNRSWNPASDPPKEAGEYIVMIRGATIPTTLFFSTISKAWYEFDDDERENPYAITHWQPLPKPPKED